MSAVKGIAGKLIGFVLLAGIVFGLFVAVAVSIDSYHKADAESWPSRKGVVTKSYVSYHSVRESGSRGGLRSLWKAEVCGEYKDNRERFCASRVRFGDWRFDKVNAREAVARYPVGREIDVYYSPENPKETILEAHSSWNETFVFLGLGVGFLLLPVFLWLFRKKIEPE